MSNTDSPFVIREACFPEEVETVRSLFLEYADSLGFDLCFQGLSEELVRLPGAYAAPSGRVLLALAVDHVAGCVAVRKIGDDVCEMKRMYVRPRFRGLGLGRFLATEIVRTARNTGYRVMRLDTVTTVMQPAATLYRSLGFRSIPAYYANPVFGAEYMELEL